MQVSVEQLIKLLEQQPKDALVWHMGQDHEIKTSRVTYNPDDNTVLIDSEEEIT